MGNGMIPKSGHRFSEKIMPIKHAPEKLIPAFGKGHASKDAVRMTPRRSPL